MFQLIVQAGPTLIQNESENEQIIMKHKTKHIIIIILTLINAFSALITAPVFAQKPHTEYFVASTFKNGVQTRHALITLRRLPKNRVSIIEDVTCRYNFFPDRVHRVIEISKFPTRLETYHEVRLSDGGSERTFTDRKGDWFFQVADFKRFFYFNKTKAEPGGATPLDKDSPALLYRLFNKNLSLAPGLKKKPVNYIAPSGDSTTRKGILQGQRGKIVFTGLFKAVAVVKFQRIQHIELPDTGARINIRKIGDSGEYNVINLKTASPGGLSNPAPAFELKSSKYKKIPIAFRSVDGVLLSGILTMPIDGGPHPGFVLLPGSGPYTRSGGGLLASISHSLAENGVATLRYDKRGVGKSKGDYSTSGIRKFYLDADAAVNFLAGQNNIDKKRMGIFGHSEGALIAARVATENKNIRGLIIMASPSIKMFPKLAVEQGRYLETVKNWTPNILKNYLQSLKMILNHIKKGRLWLEYRGRRFYLGGIDSYFNWPEPVKTIKRVGAPVLILHGDNDLLVPISHSYNLNAALQEAGNKKTDMITFTNAGHFLGRFVEPSPNHPFRRHVRPDEKVTQEILKWVKKWYQ